MARPQTRFREVTAQEPRRSSRAHVAKTAGRNVFGSGPQPGGLRKAHRCHRYDLLQCAALVAIPAVVVRRAGRNGARICTAVCADARPPLSKPPPGTQPMNLAARPAMLGPAVSIILPTF